MKGIALRILFWLGVVLTLGIVLALLEACAPAATSARATSYETELVLCNQRATTLRESIDCENDVRARYGRPPRALPADGGAE